MQLPAKLQDAIRVRLGAVPAGELRQASRRLTEAYGSETALPHLRDRSETLAYVAVRMPATYAAVYLALEEASRRIAGFSPNSVLDLGAGPGTAMWAAAEVFPSLSKMRAVERNGKLSELGQELARDSEMESLLNAEWQAADLGSWRSRENFDLVMASYSLGELSAAERGAVLKHAWQCCTGALVIVEPGTRRGFGVITEARRQMLSLGATLAAPCPHGLACPMEAAGDWCHFAARVERSGEHRRLKGGELGYEDEKFSYVVASKLPVLAAAARIVRHPMRYSGYTKLQLCTPQGLQERTVTRSQKELYRKVKRADWGSGWDES